MEKITVLREKILKLESDKENCTTERLSVLDLCQPKIYVKLCYFFKNETNGDVDAHIEHLISGLKVVLEEYPEIAGTIEYKQDGGYLNHDNRGVKVIISSANFSFVEVEESGFNMKMLPESQIFPSEVQGFVFTKDAYLFVLHFVILADKSLIVSINAHHVLSDAHGLFRLMRAWSSATKFGHVGEFKNETKRSTLVGNGENPINGSVSDRGYQFLTGPPGELPPMKMNHHVFDVILDKLEDLKQQCSENLPTDEFLSKNDVLTAVIWKAAINARLHKCIESSMCQTAINCRKRFGLSDNYVGNCVTLICQRFNTDDITKMSVKEIACKIRKNYDIMTREFIIDLMNWLEEKPSLMGAMSSANIFGNDLLFSSLVQHPIYDIDFGLGKPHNISAESNSKIPGIVWIFPTADKKSFRIEFCLEESEMIIFLADPYVKDLLRVIH